MPTSTSDAPDTPPVRLGRFAIPTEWVYASHPRVCEVMRQCIVVRAIPSEDGQRIQYSAICDKFDEIWEGEQIPPYQLAFYEETLIVRRLKEPTYPQEDMYHLWWLLEHEKWEELHRVGLTDSDLNQPAGPTPQWTDNPTTTGAYWEHLPQSELSMVWIHDGKIFSSLSDPTGKYNMVDACVARGCLYYGPIPHPPSPPDKEN